MNSTLSLADRYPFNDAWLTIGAWEWIQNSTILDVTHPHWYTYPPTPYWVHTVFSVFVTFVATLSSLGNLLVIYVFLRQIPKSSLLGQSGIYTTNLAISDFLSPAMSYYLFSATSFSQTWIFGRTLCELYGFIQGFFGLMSIVTLAVISAERYYAITYPFKVRDITFRHRLGATILVWVYCFLVASAPLWGWSRYGPAGFLTSCCFDYLSKTWLARSFIIYLFTFGFTIPVTVIVFSYVHIFMVVRQSERSSTMTKSHGSASASVCASANIHVVTNRTASAATIRSRTSFTSNNNNNNTSYDSNTITAAAPAKPVSSKPPKLSKQVRKDVKMARVMMIVIVSFVGAWSPYAVVALMGQMAPESWLTPLTAMTPAIFAKTSTLYNPIIYAFKDSKFKAAIKSLFPFLAKIENFRQAESVGESSAASETSQDGASAAGGGSERRRPKKTLSLASLTARRRARLTKQVRQSVNSATSNEQEQYV